MTVCGVPLSSEFVQNTVLFTPITIVTVSGEKPGAMVEAPLGMVTLTQAEDGQVTEGPVDVDVLKVGAITTW